MYNYEITFLEWLKVGFPLASLTLIVTWLILVYFLFPMKPFKLGDAKDIINEEINNLGKMTRPELTILIIACTMATLWILSGFLFKHIPSLSFVKDSTIAIGGAVVLFATPVNLSKGEFLLDWKTAVKIPWDVVLLFGGGLALANAYQTTDLTMFIAHKFQNFEGLSPYVFMTIVVIFTIALTEVTSNTATATLLVPIMGTVAVALNMNPLGPMLAAAISASYAFMLPVATPPNAVAYGSGCFTIRNMAFAGLWIDLVCFILIPVVLYLGITYLWHEDLTTIPLWLQNAVSK